ncbi:hypothetical protein K2C01_003861 [Vibrio vulnificus]|nr:hypothetical protein [Vibrio vulnificus]RZR40881.1 hypothetical protein D8T58_21640 [Vibrio vulnificus]HDY8229140.1 hypothetical protein [Vibrio vulnificus]
MIPGVSTGGGSLDMGGGGPSSASGTNNFTGGSLNMGSNNGVPTWALVGGALLVAFLMFGRGRGKR